MSADDDGLKGVIVDYDFAAMNGADLLFDTTKEFLSQLDGIPFDISTEARYFAGRNYLDGIETYFGTIKTKKTALKSARDLNDTVVAAITNAVPGSITGGVRNFVKALIARGVRVVLMTRSDIDALRPTFEAAFGTDVILHREQSLSYGGVTWDAWRRAMEENGLKRKNVAVVTGSGDSVKAALLAGVASLAVVREHVAYQDFGGADIMAHDLSAPVAKKLLDVLHA